MTDQTVNEWDVGQALTLQARALSGLTVGSIGQASSTLLVRDPSGISMSDHLFVAGAGAVGGDLLATVTAINGQSVSLSIAAFAYTTLAEVGVLYDPPLVTAKIRLPDLTEATLSVTRASLGLYTASYTIAAAGDHFYRFIAAGFADTWRQFRARTERVP